MAKSPKKLKLEEIETKPDAWKRFEGAMEKIAPPKPHKPPKDKEGKAEGGDRRQGHTRKAR